MVMREQGDENLMIVEAIRRGDSRGVHPALRRAVRYALEHRGDQLSLGQIATAAGVSTPYLCALARHAFSMGFMRVLRLYRAVKVKELLDATDRSVATICEELAFRNLWQLQRAVRQVYGCTPSQYRQMALKQRRQAFLEQQIQTGGRQYQNRNLTGSQPLEL